MLGQRISCMLFICSIAFTLVKNYKYPLDSNKIIKILTGTLQYGLMCNLY